jgi:hypothetical protein
LQLKEHYSTLEEAKADAMGEWVIFKLQEKDYFPPSIYQQQAATYLAGLFRSVRFGIGEAHGQANAIQFNYLLEKGTLQYDEASGRFSMDASAFPGAMADLVRDICILQAEGNYEGTAEFISRYGGMPPVLEKALTRLMNIPVDIKPVFASST